MRRHETPSPTIGRKMRFLLLGLLALSLSALAFPNESPSEYCWIADEPPVAVEP